MRRLTQGGLFRVVTECRVEGEPLRTVDDVDLVAATVERIQLRQQLAGRWAEWGARLDAPVPPAGAAPEPEMWAGRLLAEAVDALEWERRRWPELRATLSVVLPGCPRAVDAGHARPRSPTWSSRRPRCPRSTGSPPSATR